MRIVFATTGLFPDVIGGMERHSLHLVRRLAELGAEIDLIHPIPGRTYFTDLGNVRNVFLPWRKFRFPYHYIRESWAYSQSISRYIRNLQVPPDIVFGQGYTVAAYVRRRRCPCIFHPHGLEAFQARPGTEWLSLAPFRWLTRYTAAHSDRVISLGGRLTDILREAVAVPGARITEIPNAVDLSFVDQPVTVAARLPKSFIFVGRIAANKGLDVLLPAMAAIEDPDVRLFVIGGGAPPRRVPGTQHGSTYPIRW